MAKKRVGKFPKAFRQMAVDRLNQCDNIGELREKLAPLECGEGPPATRWHQSIQPAPRVYSFFSQQKPLTLRE